MNKNMKSKKKTLHQLSMIKKIKLFECPVCHLKYEDKKWANKCEAWCKKHKSCNLEIIKHALKV